MGFSFGTGGFGSGLGGGGIGNATFDDEGNLTGFGAGFSLGSFGFDLGGAIGGEFGGFGDFVFRVPSTQIQVEGPTQSEIEAAIEAEIAAERAADAERFGGGGGEDPEGPGPGGIPQVIGGPGGPTLGDLQALAIAIGVPISSILETETPVEDAERGEPPREGVPAEVEDREALPPCVPQPCEPDRGLPAVILNPIINLVRRLTLQFPLNIDIQRQLQFLLSLTGGNGGLSVAGMGFDQPPGEIPTLAADACGFFREIVSCIPGCRCVCQSPVRACCGGAAGCDCEPC